MLKALVAEKDAEIQRLTDLVRYERHSLFDAMLITPEEFAALVDDSDNGQRVARLNSWDGVWQAQQQRIRKLVEALERLRDCDWVISLPDRMDAVREIARAALAAEGVE